MSGSEIFVDWITISQHHPAGGLPIFISGVAAQFDSAGNCRFERGLSETVCGSYESSVRVLSDGFRVWLSGNPGRFGRQDNLFNLGWVETLAACNRILAMLGLPPFTAGKAIPGNYGLAGESGNGGTMAEWGAVVSRIDLTCNYATGSDAQARAVIRHLSGRSVKRMKRGYAGDESVWFSNTRHMLKIYRKGAEMRKHGGDERAIDFAESHGLVRAEVELKKRLLCDLGLNRLENITHEKLAAVFEEQTEVFRRVDMSDEPDILAAIPPRYRPTAAAWMAGQDVKAFMTNGTLYRHAKILRGFGLDILEARNIQQFPVKIRVVDLEPVAVPDWYSLKAA